MMENRWVPVTDRLPDMDVPVLLTIAVPEPRMALCPAHRFQTASGWRWTYETSMPVASPVIAWMPLPAPYRPEGT